jgi:uncharacterized protein
VTQVPVRQCAGCRRRRPADELIRFQVREGKARVVPVAGPGRSVYLCPERACLDAAVRRRALAHTLRQPAVTDDGTLAQFTMACEERKAVR